MITIEVFLKKSNRSKALMMMSFLSLYCTTVSAANLGISPLGLKLSSQDNSGIITVNNLGDESIFIQAEALSWTKENNKYEYLPTNDLLIHPQILTILSGKSQKLSVGVKQAQDITVEKAYRLLLTEMPKNISSTVHLTEREPKGLTTLLQFNLPIYMTPITAIHIQQWHAQYNANGNIILTLKNKGNVHIRINEIVVHHNSAPISFVLNPLNAVVFPEQSESWEINLESGRSLGRTIRLEVKTDTGVQSILLNVAFDEYSCLLLIKNCI